MGEGELTHLVGGGILAILVLDRVTNLVRVVLGKKNGAAAGIQSVEFWQQNMRTGIRDTLNDAIAPVLRQQAEILIELKDITAKNYEMLLRAQIRTESAHLQDRSHRDGV
mgnify:CR=1 FL=1